MTLRRVTAPDLPVTVEEAKFHARVTGTDDDALIEGYIRAALAHAEKWCSRIFVTQTWELVLDAFPAGEINLGIGPVASVVHVAYADADGAEQMFDVAGYEVDTVSPVSWVVPVGEWPATMETINAVRVRFIVGTDDLPEDVRIAILLMVAHWYNHRETASADDIRQIPLGAMALLDLHRILFA